LSEKHKDLLVFVTHRTSRCVECGEELGPGRMIGLKPGKKPICLTCADLDHLVFLPSGDAALTLRAKKHSQLWAVVLKFSRSRKRNERQGLLVESRALERAEEECAADEDERAARRAQAAKRRKSLDRRYIAQFAGKVRELFPNCPEGREMEIARHACEKHSGRVGRSAAAKELEEGSVRMAVIAHLRHAETHYDRLLMNGWERFHARQTVKPRIDDLLEEWEGA
jgi:hypothetical protein